MRDCYKNSPANYKACMEYLKEHGYLDRGHSVITQQTGNCDDTMYMTTEVTGLTETQLGEFREFFGKRLRDHLGRRRHDGFFVVISHTD